MVGTAFALEHFMESCLNLGINLFLRIAKFLEIIAILFLAR